MYYNRPYFKRFILYAYIIILRRVYGGYNYYPGVTETVGLASRQNMFNSNFTVLPISILPRLDRPPNLRTFCTRFCRLKTIIIIVDVYNIGTTCANDDAAGYRDYRRDRVFDLVKRLPNY